MGSIYVARLRNAHRIGRRIKNILKAGGLVFDENGEAVRSCSYRGFSGKVGLRVNDSFVFFDADVDLDNGMHTTIAEFNDYFRDWIFVDPTSVKPFLRKRAAAGTIVGIRV
jgi:hypothetical protein